MIDIDRYKLAASLQAKGLTYREIGGVLGVSRQRASQLCKPPKHIYRMLRARAKSKCEDCGQALDWGRVHHVRYGDDPWELDDLLYLCAADLRKRELGQVQEVEK